MTAMHPRSQVYSPTHMACITDVDTDGDGYAPIWDRALKDRAELAERLAIEAWQKQSVYDLADQKIGRVVDLVIKKDGAVPAAIVSVGGFLGIATKYVAVPFTAFQATPAERRPHLVLDTNRKALRSAPAFEFNRLTGRWERVEDN